ncbi:MAG: sigma-70 family RNA polymerase sigma factor [Acidobacteria bacterium]|nr:sigma-70 family RNA polymerase sigma factor [Acidobacteriota bacterium]
MHELYDRHAAVIFSYAYRIARDRALADEATQDVFIQAWRDASRYDETRGTVRAWLLVIARGRTLDRLRARSVRSRLVAHPEVWPPYGSSPESGAVADQQKTVIAGILDFLPSAERRVMELAFYEGLTHTEVAQLVERPLGSVKTQIRRTLRLLRAATEETAARPFDWLPRWTKGEPSSREPLRGASILIVDDEADTVKLLTLVLRRAGAAVLSASSATQALKRLAAVWPDVLVSDLEMPGTDGCELLTRVRELRDWDRKLLAVAFTAHGEEHDRRRIAGAGFDLHLKKPVRPAVLVRHLVALRQARMELRTQSGAA